MGDFLKTKRSSEKKEREEREAASLREDLDEFQSCKGAILQAAAGQAAAPAGEEYFFRFVQRAFTEAHRLYRRSKRRAWSLGRLLSVLACSFALPASAWYVFFFADFKFSAFVKNWGVAAAFTMAAGFFIAYLFSKWHDQRAYHETWVRHSAYYHRMRLELSRFLASSRHWEDYQRFKEQVYAVQNQNLDQFVLNLSGRGMAARPERSGPQERGKRG